MIYVVNILIYVHMLINKSNVLKNIEQNQHVKIKKFNLKGNFINFKNSYSYYFNFSSQILRLTQHNKRNTERLAELQRCLDQIKGTITGQKTYDQLRDILRLVLLMFLKNKKKINKFRDSIISDGETTGDLSDKNCTGDELDGDNSHMPKVVSQSNGIGAIKRPINIDNNINYDQVYLLKLIKINNKVFFFSIV